MQPEFGTVTRSLEMLLDQLYYWARRAVEQRREGGDREIADRMLTLATENLERFVTTLLDCFRDIQLARMPVQTSELVAALMRRARDEVTSASVVVREDGETSVLADVAQLGRVWSAIVRRFGPEAGALEITVAAATHGDRPGVEIVVQRSGTPHPLVAPDVTTDLEWALALRIVELHGWELREDASPRARGVVVFLPAN
jgi:hypothetical protein